MRTALGVRRGIQMSPVSKADWARAVGISYSNLNALVAGASNMQNGPAMGRLKQLFDALDNHRVQWLRKPARFPHGRAYHVLDGRERFTPTATMMSLSLGETGPRLAFERGAVRYAVPD